MSLIVNTNVGSLNAQRSLAASGAELKTAMERLSSGKKINSAADDAAGFAIAERMTAQIRGLNMATKNTNDGLSMLAVVENATNDVTDMLHRMRELAVQSVNDTNSLEDRQFLQKEVTALIDEIDRVATQTQYNNQLVLNGSFQSKSIQVGTESGQTINFSVSSIRISGLAGLGELGPKLGMVHWHSDDDGVQPGTFAYMYPPSNNIYPGEAAVDFSSFANLKTGDKVFYGLNGDGSDATLHTVSSIDTSEYDAANGLDEFGITLIDSNGNAVNPAGYNDSYVFTAATVSHIDVSTNPSDALVTISAAIEQVAGDRAAYGALQNRLEYTVSNLMNVAEFTTSARSRIEDADFAAESARLAKAQVLQQTGTAMLAQANAQPQLALLLIR